MIYNILIIMKKILILFAHPRYENSKANQSLVNAIPLNEHITFHDLYEAYPFFDINIEYEKELLLNHDIIIWQHPFYWYSAPPLLKQWMDLVLEYGWAYGHGGEALKGKAIFNAITTGGQRKAYCTEGHNQYTINEFLVPFRQTANLCKMNYLPPFVLYGTHRVSDQQLRQESMIYGKLLEKLINEEIDVGHLSGYPSCNDWFKNKELWKEIS